MREFCPECNAIRNMVKTTTTKTVASSDWILKTITTITLHCAKCGSLLRKKILEG